MIGAPGFLAIAALLLALPPLLRGRGAGYYSARRGWLLIALRLGSAVILVVAAGGMHRSAQPPPRELVALVDVSASIEAGQRESRDAFLEQVGRGLPPGTALKQVRFAATAVPVDGGQAGAESSVSAAGTNLAEAIELAKGLVTPGRDASFLILSDGEETQGSASAALEGLRSAGIPVFARELPAARGEHAALGRVLLPRRVIPRERFDVKVAVRGGAQPMRVRLARAGREDEVREAPPAGREQELIFSEAAPDAGVLHLRLRLEPPAAGALPAEERLFEVPVAPPVPVTLLSDTPAESRAVGELLEQGGSPVTVLSPDLWRTLPEEAGEPGLIVLDNVPAPSLGIEGMEKIERLVRARGAGLLVFGGMQSLGAGGYAATPLERVLPTALDAPGRGPDAELGLVIVLDASLSMFFQARGGSGGAGPPPRKIDLAKAAVLAVVDVLRPEDQIGLLASRDQLVWARRPAPLGDRDELEERVLGIHAIGGGINFYSSIREAYEVLRAVPTRIRHVMLLADANDIDQFEVKDVGRSPDLIRAMAEEGVTLSIFALGMPSDKDVAFLRSMAQLGRGDFYLVANAISLPRYFRSEYQRKTGERIREESFSPLVRSFSPVLRGLDLERLPETTAVNLLAVKPGAEEILVSPGGAPLLALWRYGRGRTAVFSGDSGTRWARSWFSGADAERFWMQLAHELAPRTSSPAIEAVSERDGSRLRLLLRRRDGALLPPAPGRVVFGVSGAPSANLERQGLLQFEASLPGGAQGASVFRLEGDLVRGQAEVAGAVDLPGPVELRRAGRGRFLLAELVEGTGGAWVRTPAEVAARLAIHPARTAHLFWLLLVALLFLLGEVLLRY